MQAFERALALADEIGDVSLQLPALFGQWAGRHIAGTGSAELARRFAALAETQPDSGARLVGLRMLALESFFESRFEESLALTQRALDSYDEAVHRDLCHRFGHDPRAAALNYKAWNLWHLGFPDQAAQTIEDNLRWVRELNHANTTGLALCYGATLVNIWLRRPEQVEQAAREALRLAEEMSLALWHVWAQIHLGWALSQQGDAAGIEEIEAGLEGARQIGAGRLEPFHLALAAEAYRAPAGTAKPRRGSPRHSRPSGGAITPISPRNCIASGRRSCCAPIGATAARPRPISAARWRSPASRSRPRCNCAPRATSRGCWPSAASASRPPTSWPRSTAGSPRASTRPT